MRRTSGTLSVRLARLERAGYVERERDPDDRRGAIVTLTDRGRERVEAARPAYDDTAARLAAGLPDDDREQFAERLRRWLGFFEPDDRVAPRLGVAVAPGGRRAAHAPRGRAARAPRRPRAASVRRGSAAETAGLARGDLVIGAAGTDVHTIGDLHRALAHAGASLALDVVRGVEERAVTVALPGASAELADLRQVDVEDERRVRRDRRRLALRAVREVGRDRQPPPAADLHPDQALVPALDDLALAERQLEGRLAALPGGVELLVVVVEIRRRSGPTILSPLLAAAPLPSMRSSTFSAFGAAPEAFGIFGFVRDVALAGRRA